MSNCPRIYLGILPSDFQTSKLPSQFVVKAFLNIWTWTIQVLEKASEEVKGDIQLNSLPTIENLLMGGKKKQFIQLYLILKSVLTRSEILLDTNNLWPILLLLIRPHATGYDPMQLRQY